MANKVCQVCSFPVKDSWNFCPNCGTALSKNFEKAINLKVPIEVLQSLGPMVDNLMQNIFQAKSNGEWHSKNMDMSQQNLNAGISTVIEPEDYVTNFGGSVIHTIYIPGVKSRSDITVNKFENSLEIKAKADDKFYLKIIKREKDEVVASEEFSKDNFILKLKKKNK
ncbi:MAG: zinc ribbon domain-containing protein [Candidatus Parvarchaeota archaeon]|nr:zinc ribbon domain-containing protein [Candidatus Parvarchaeota archaeon]MCW1301637.1 zinc ribbon domain-containing protein [Candidatus Parvarchaeota archaeon]